MVNLVESVSAALLVLLLTFISCSTDMFNPSTEELQERAAKLRGHQPPP